MKHISSYPTVYALGHSAIAGLFNGEVVVEEKVDGSQFSMCREGGELSCRSKGKDLILDAPEKMFIKAIDTAQSLDLHDGWVYRCEYLQSPKHNALQYARVPEGHLIVFDVCTGPETYLNPKEKEFEASRIGLECVPLMRCGMVPNFDEFGAFLEKESVLGGCKVEGVVIKNYSLFTKDKKVAIGKYVSEAFKEKHQKEWKGSNPNRLDAVQAIIASLRTEARWRKAIQHLKESGVDVETPKAIGAFIREIQADVQKEESDYIREELFKHFWPQISRAVIRGAPEFFKSQLAEKAFQGAGQ